jgi:hypothetical protein
MAIREGWWDCTYCSTPNRGREMHCQACGKPRDPSIQFYIPEVEPEVTDEQLAAIAKGGADWTCSFCGTDNRAAMTSCRQCSADKGDSIARAEKILKAGETGKEPPRSESNSQEPNTNQGQNSKPTKPTKPQKKRPKWLLPVLLGAAALLVFLGVQALRVQDVPLEVIEASWERTIDVESQEMVRRTDWADRVPSDARILRTWEEQDGTERVQVGTERVVTGRRDLGNGFFEDIVENRPVYENRPVFRRRAEYERLEWVVQRTASITGRYNEPIVWPPVQLRAGERQGRQTTTTRAQVRDPESGRTYTNTPKPESLVKLAPGTRLVGRINGLGILTGLVLDGEEL